MSACASGAAPGFHAMLLSAALRGARFGAKFTFWFLIAVVTAPIIVMAVANIATRPAGIWYLLSASGLVRFVIPAVGVPLAGAAIGAAAGAVLFPLAALFNGRPSRGEWTEYEPVASPLDDVLPGRRSREELLRRIVGGSNDDARDAS